MVSDVIWAATAIEQLPVPPASKVTVSPATGNEFGVAPPELAAQQFVSVKTPEHEPPDFQNLAAAEAVELTPSETANKTAVDTS
jgi:hypothetical protein